MLAREWHSRMQAGRSHTSKQPHGVRPVTLQKYVASVLHEVDKTTAADKVKLRIALESYKSFGCGHPMGAPRQLSAPPDPNKVTYSFILP